jgi:hypothetical protein
MGILKQPEPVFKTSQEVKEFIKQKQDALQFWGSISSMDMSELIEELKRSIVNAKLVLMEMKK